MMAPISTLLVAPMPPPIIVKGQYDEKEGTLSGEISVYGTDYPFTDKVKKPVFLLYSEDAFFILLILLFVYIPLFLFLFIVHWQIKMKGLIKLYNCILDKYSELTIAKIIDEFKTNKKWQKITLLIACLLDITGVILLFNFYHTNNNEQNILSIFIMVIMIYLMACGGLLPSYINLFKNWNSKYI